MIDTGDTITFVLLCAFVIFTSLRLERRIDRLDRFVAKVARKVNGGNEQ